MADSSDRKYDDEGIPYNKEDLPYGGDRLKALRAQDRPAITLIMKWGNKYGNPVAIKEEVKLLPEAAKSCRNEEDYISHDRWTENYLPTIFIKYMNYDGTFEGTDCYKTDDINTMIDNPQNNFAAWVPPNGDTIFDDNGFVIDPNTREFYNNKYAEPSIIELFVELPVRRFFLRRNLLDKINQTLGQTTKFVAVPVYKTRVGNTQGGYGSGQLHGQEPDKTIYYIVKESDFDNGAYKDIYNEIFKLKTSNEYDGELNNITLDVIHEIHSTIPVSMSDQLYYWLGRSIEDSLSGNITANGLSRFTVQEEVYYPSTEGEERSILTHPSTDTSIKGKVMNAVYELYKSGKIIQYNEMTHENLTHSEFVLTTDVDPNKKSFETLTDALTNSDKIIFTYFSIMNTPSSHSILDTTLRDQIDSYLEQNESADPYFGRMLYTLNYMFSINTTIWVLPEEDGTIEDIIFGSSLNWLYLRDEPNWVSITGWNDFNNDISIDTLINTIAFRPSIEKDMSELLSFFDDPNGGPENFMQNVYIVFYYMSASSIVSIVKDEKINWFTHDIINIPTNINEPVDLLRRTELENITMIDNSPGVNEMLGDVTIELMSENLILYPSDMEELIHVQLNKGKILYIDHPSKWDYRYVDTNDSNTVLEFKKGDEINLPTSVLFGLFVFDEGFRNFVDEKTDEDYKNIETILINEIEEYSLFIISDATIQEQRWLTKVVNLSNIQSNSVLYVVYKLYQQGKIIQYEDEVNKQLLGASFILPSEKNPSMKQFDTILDALSHSYILYNTYSNYVLNSNGHENQFYTTITDNLEDRPKDDMLGGMLSLLSYLLSNNVVIWILPSNNGIEDVIVGTSYTWLYLDSNSWVNVARWKDFGDIDIEKVISFILNHHELKIDMLTLTSYIVNNVINVKKIMSDLYFAFYYISKSGYSGVLENGNITSFVVSQANDGPPDYISEPSDLLYQTEILNIATLVRNTKLWNTLLHALSKLSFRKYTASAIDLIMNIDKRLENNEDERIIFEHPNDWRYAYKSNENDNDVPIVVIPDDIDIDDLPSDVLVSLFVFDEDFRNAFDDQTPEDYKQIKDLIGDILGEHGYLVS